MMTYGTLETFEAVCLLTMAHSQSSLGIEKNKSQMKTIGKWHTSLSL